MARLFRVYCRSKSGKTLEWVRPGTPIRIGRNPSNECRIDDPERYISNFHAELTWVGDKLSVRDCGSKNGIMCGGRRIESDLPFTLTPPEHRFVLGDVSRGWEMWVTIEAVANASPEVAPGGPPSAGTESVPPLLPVSDERSKVPVPVAGPPEDTGAFPDLTMEQLALQSLEQLASSLVPTKELTSKGDIVRFARKLYDAVDVFCRCFVPLRVGYDQFISAVELKRAAGQRTVNRSNNAQMVEFARDPATLGTALFDWTDRHKDAPEVLESIFTAIMNHHAALFESVLPALDGLLDELSPEKIEAVLSKQQPNAMALALTGRHRALWHTFEARYKELRGSCAEQVFGSTFAEAYRQYQEKRRDRG